METEEVDDLMADRGRWMWMERGDLNAAHLKMLGGLVLEGDDGWVVWQMAPGGAWWDTSGA